MAQKSEPGKPASYQVVARRFRPKAFDEVVGQQAIQASLRAALQSGRIPHAFLFAGSRGVGKTTTARILARCLNCETGPTPDPCGQCALCRSILDGSNPDVLEMDAASNRGIDDVRPLIERIATASMMSRYKVYILDEAHMLTTPAWNALLKTLEEPPPGVVFVLATTELHKVPDTISSRCQVLRFRRIVDADIKERLQMIATAEGIALPDEVLEEIAAGSRGGMRDAETALERTLQLAREHEGTFDLQAYREFTQRLGVDRAVDVTQALLAGDARRGLQFCSELMQSGADEREALGDLVDVLRALLLLQVDGADSGLVPHTGAVRQKLVALAAGAPRPRVEAMLQAALLGRERLRRLEDRAAVLELTVVRMAEAGSLPTLGELVAAARSGTLAIGQPAGASPSAGGPVVAAAPTGASARATPAPVAAEGDLHVRVVAAVREQPLLAATLELCRFRGPDAQGVVTVSLDTDRKMHRDRLLSPGVQRDVEKVVRAVAPGVTGVAFEVAEPRSGSSSPAAAAPPGPAAQRALSRLGGRVVAVDPEDHVRSSSPTPKSEDGDQDAAPVTPDDRE